MKARAAKVIAQKQMSQVLALVVDVEAKLQELQDTYMAQATQKKAEVETKAVACVERLGLAERLVSGLVIKKYQWTSEINKLRYQVAMLVGDVPTTSTSTST